MGSNQPLTGNWLCPPGPYCDLIDSLCSAEPRLRFEDKIPAIQSTSLWNASSRINHLAVDSQGQTKRNQYKTAQDLQDSFSNKEDCQGNIYIIESIDRDVINVLGSHFWIHPSFFADHVRLKIVAIGQKRTIDHNILSSHTFKESDTFCLRYHEPLYFGIQLPSFLAACASTGRHIAVYRDGEGHGKSDIGTARRKCSFWQRFEEDGRWNCIVLVDPPISRLRIDWYDNLMTVSVKPEPYQGGFIDFYPKTEQLKDCLGPPRTSFLDDFCFYWNRSSTNKITKDCKGPELASLLCQKIILGHYCKVIDFSKAVNAKRQKRLTRRDHLGLDITVVEQQWSDSQQMEKRLDEFSQDLETILFILGIEVGCRNSRAKKLDWTDTSVDFQLLYKRLKDQHTRGKEFNKSMTGLASIAGNRQASARQELATQTAKMGVREAKSAKALTIVGLVFIPLAFTSQFLSMNPDYLPGSRLFSLYLAISFPLVTVVVLCYFIMDRGYDDLEAKWSFATLLHRLSGRSVSRSTSRSIALLDIEKQVTPSCYT
jgi:hypothetical protein